MLTNELVIELHALGMGDNVIIEKIRSSQCRFDTTLEGLRRLKTAKVPDSVIAEMIRAREDSGNVMDSRGERSAEAGDASDPSVYREAGIYLYEEKDGHASVIG